LSGEDLLAQLQPGEALLLPAYPQFPGTFEIPIFFEPLDADAIARANETAWLVGVVLDGEGPLGREWIRTIREWAHMVPGNTQQFGTSPYYYAFRHSRPSPSHENDPPSPRHRDKVREVQHLVYVQGGPDLKSRRRTALAMLRQWQAERIPNLNLARIKPEYFAEGPALLQAPATLAVRASTARADDAA
jgi:hypothetical protein